MRTATYGLLLSFLAGCGPHETHFIPDYADLYCDYYIACTDPAVLTFDGVDGRDACLADVGPRIDQAGEGCKYKAKKAKRCLHAMELLSCPAEGEPLDDNLPTVCDEVYVDCTGEAATTTPSDTDDTGT